MARYDLRDGFTAWRFMDWVGRVMADFQNEMELDAIQSPRSDLRLWKKASCHCSQTSTTFGCRLEKGVWTPHHPRKRPTTRETQPMMRRISCPLAGHSTIPEAKETRKKVARRAGTFR